MSENVSFNSPEFIEQIKARHPQTINKLVSNYNHILYRACLSQGLSDLHAEDILQATWSAFFSSIDRFENRSHIRTYLFGILYNKMKEHWRDQKKYQTTEDITVMIDEQFDADDQWAYSPVSPERFLQATETLTQIKQCMEGLTDQQKTAFYLKEVEGESSDSICNVLSISHTNLRVILYRAKNKLRKCLEGWSPIEQSGSAEDTLDYN